VLISLFESRLNEIGASKVTIKSRNFFFKRKIRLKMQFPRGDGEATPAGPVTRWVFCC
jgi:hypothetical protein